MGQWLSLLHHRTSTRSKTCGLERVGDRFLKYHDTEKTWFEAMSICLLEKGSLVIDDNPLIHTHLQLKANGEKGLEMWIGATDLGHEGIFVWLNGARVGQGHATDWFPGEPSNKTGGGIGGEHCVTMSNRGRNYSKWNDAPCDRKYTFFCQI